MSKPIEFIVVLTYLALMVIIGSLYRKQSSKSEESFLLADRSIGVALGGGALAATYTSTGGFLGALGSAYTFGIGAHTWNTGALGLGFLIALVAIAPQLRRAGVTTLADFFEKRFDNRARFLAALATVITMSVYVIAQITGGALALQFLLNIPGWIGVLLIGAVFTIYVALGGMHAATVTSFWQNLMMMVGMIVPAILILTRLGWTETVAAATVNNPAAVATFPAPGASFSISLAVLLMLGFLASPHVLMRFYSAPDEKIARKTVATGLVYVMAFYMAIPIVAIGVMARFPDLTTPDYGYLLLVEELFHPVIVGIFIAALLAAAMSSTDAMLLAASSAISYDLYRLFSNTQPDPQRAMKITRISVIVLGTLTTLIAIDPPSLILLVIALAQSLLVGAFLIPLLLGIWWRRATSTGCIAAMIGGLLTVPITHPSVNLLPAANPFLPGIYAAVVALVLCVGFSLVTVDKPTQAREELLTRMHGTPRPYRTGRTQSETAMS